ncbi:MAG: type 4a pilus biogenesis protein PilO [Polyangiaceae bacterium]|nr:type 4a pilus biogenesis protein PilO [Polyangiaceae bacterium]MBK8936960.1 type 4a pilus biogenesis protein PilO [Polyangiaceae bacterium]
MAVKTSTSSLARLSLPAKFVFALILMGIVAALYFVVFFTDVDGQINQAIAQEQSLKGELQQAEEAKAAYQKDVEERAKKQQSEREQRKVLPDEAETPSFLSSVQGIATISGVTLKTYKPEDEGSEEYYVRVPMSLELEGRFHQIARFFFGVGQLDRVINIENIEMEVMPTQAASDTGEVVLAVKCLATAFRSKKSGEPEKGKK